MKTSHIKKGDVQKDWWLVNAANRPVGRLATELATLLRGKHKAQFSPHVDGGDFVLVINANQVHFTGKKWSDKKYYSHSGFFGSLKTKSAKDLTGTELIRRAVGGMLPKNKQRHIFLKKLKIYETSAHPHAAQKPSARTDHKNKVKGF